MRRNVLIPAFLALVPGVLAQTGPGKRQLTARELFYVATNKPATAPVTPETKPARRPKPVQAKVSHKPARPKPVAPEPAISAPGGGASYVQAAYAPQQGVPLGLRYTILKKVEDQMVEVPVDTVFHAGDRIQVSVESNDGGYLYIVHQGSSGAWKPLFPSAEIEDGANRIEKGRTYVMPPKSRFYFDEQAGTEKLFIVLSRQPEPDLEKLIYSLREAKPSPAAEPAARPARAPVLIASNQIDDGVVGRLRNAYARDLVVEKVDDAASSAVDHKEKAVYVVNPSGSPDARVVADIALIHQ